MISQSSALSRWRPPRYHRLAVSAAAHAASFDGPWSVLVITRSGPCDQSFRYGVMIRGSTISYMGEEPSACRVGCQSGQVSVSVSASGRARSA
jgi:hypothetical protein